MATGCNSSSGFGDSNRCCVCHTCQRQMAPLYSRFLSVHDNIRTHLYLDSGYFEVDRLIDLFTGPVFVVVFLLESWIQRMIEKGEAESVLLGIVATALPVLYILGILLYLFRVFNRIPTRQIGRSHSRVQSLLYQLLLAVMAAN